MMKERGIKIISMGILAAAILSVVVMLLWNWLMPAIFGLATLSFWQALGLFILARILFGSLGRNKFMHHHHMHRKGENPIHEKWMKMTDEQRREFINRRKQFGFGGPFGKDRFNTKENE